ncbi:hypothetical protein G7046_g4436 [Stylonectria norvegica]|nr:hypothetical protein G7046_g4436 [Stylonectria norvegica]
MGKTKAPKVTNTPAKATRSATKAAKTEPPSAIPSKVTKATKPKATKPKATKVKKEHSHHLPTDEQIRGNGRVVGRSLISWNRPRMAEKLLLHIAYECNRHQIELPWNSIAHRMHPGSSGASIQQHMNRMRKDLVAEGHLVPPPLLRPGAFTVGKEVRGYIRDQTDGNDKETTREVLFTEAVDDRRFNLPDAVEYKNLPCLTDNEESPAGNSQHPGTPAPVPDTPTRMPHRRPRIPSSLGLIDPMSSWAEYQDNLGAEKDIVEPVLSFASSVPNTQNSLLYPTPNYIGIPQSMNNNFIPTPTNNNFGYNDPFAQMGQYGLQPCMTGSLGTPVMNGYANYPPNVMTPYDNYSPNVINPHESYALGVTNTYETIPNSQLSFGAAVGQPAPVNDLSSGYVVSEPKVGLKRSLTPVTSPTHPAEKADTQGQPEEDAEVALKDFVVNAEFIDGTTLADY